MEQHCVSARALVALVLRGSDTAVELQLSSQQTPIDLFDRLKCFSGSRRPPFERIQDRHAEITSYE
jgi:hypothetical protein